MTRYTGTHVGRPHLGRGAVRSDGLRNGGLAPSSVRVAAPGGGDRADARHLRVTPDQHRWHLLARPLLAAADRRTALGRVVRAAPHPPRPGTLRDALPVMASG